MPNNKKMTINMTGSDGRRSTMNARTTLIGIEVRERIRGLRSEAAAERLAASARRPAPAGNGIRRTIGLAVIRVGHALAGERAADLRAAVR